MAKLTTADGSIYDCNFGGKPWPGTAYITLVNAGMLETLSLFSDESKTSTMTIDDVGNIEVLEGFTKLDAIVAAGNDTRVIMKVPE